MEKQQYKIGIDAPQETVWNVLWDDKTYREWTSVFHPTSHAVTDWQKGSKVLFLDSAGSGMVARIEEKISNEFMSFIHLGEVKDGKEDLDSPAVKKWAGAHENYTLKRVGGQTELTIDMDIHQEFAKMFSEIWPKALDKVKEMAEGRGKNHS